MDLVYAAQAEEAAKVEAEAHAENEQLDDSMTFDAPEATDEAAAKKARRSRRGMVIVAKGTEVHKSETFRAAAEALGYQVEIEYTETGEVDEDDEPIIRHHAVATKGGAVVEGSWIGKAWDYANAGAGIGGKARKVRNLKEALRILQNWM
jgi:GMP synthase-like glutamine amidotransferase